MANNRNRNGEVYGFVRYAKVRNVDKLLKALNNICFGQYRVRAVLARFDRKGERRGVEVREGEGVGGEVKVRKKEAEGEKRKEGTKGWVDTGKKKEEGLLEGDAGGVRVGSVLVRVRGSKKKGGEGEGVTGRLEEKVGRNTSTDKVSEHTSLVRKIDPVKRMLHGHLGV